MVDIQVQNFLLTDSIEDHIKQRLKSMHLHFGTRISSTHVHLSDVNGPKGGKNKKCLIHVNLQKLPPIIVENTQENLYTSIDGSCHSVERAVRKALERKQTLARKKAEPYEYA